MEKLTTNIGKNLERTVDGITYERYAIKTHFIKVGEDLADLLNQYVKPYYQEGDMVSIVSKVASLCQGNVIYKKDMKISLLAKFLSKFATQHSSVGIGVGDVYKMQVAIDFCGPIKVLWAAMCSAVGKLFGKHGIFYEIVGRQISGLDGFYPDTFEYYGDFGIPLPKNPNGYCNELYQKTGMLVMLSDSNDVRGNIEGKCDQIDLSIQHLEQIEWDNPEGQSDEMTPFVLIRRKK